MGKLIPALTMQERVKQSSLIIHGELMKMPEKQGKFSILSVKILETAKGGGRKGAMITVRYDLTPPCTPDRIESLPREFRKGCEFIFFLATPEKGIYPIIDQWQGEGITPYAADRFDEIVKETQK